MQRISISAEDRTRSLTCQILGIGSESMQGVVASLRARPEVIHATTTPA